MDKSDAALIGGGLVGIIATTALGLGPIGAAATTLVSSYIGHEMVSKYNPKYS